MHLGPPIMLHSTKTSGNLLWFNGSVLLKGKKAAKQAVHVKRADWQETDSVWKGRVFGDDLNSDVTILFFATDEIGFGPRWHVHPYDEIFVVRKGNARFTIGDRRIDAQEGDILVGPAAVPHKFKNLGPGRLETTDIHLSREWIQTDLEDPDQA